MENVRGGIDEQGHYKCFFYDGIVVHEGIDMAKDIYEDSDENDILHYMACSRCGAEYEVFQKNNPSNDYPMSEELKLRKKILNDEE